jgi:acetyl-CoA acyltransferase 1
MHIANAIRNRQIDIGIGAGVESMSLFDFGVLKKSDGISKQALEHKEAQKCLIPMGITSENIAEKFRIPRIK